MHHTLVKRRSWRPSESSLYNVLEKRTNSSRKVGLKPPQASHRVHLLVSDSMVMFAKYYEAEMHFRQILSVSNRESLIKFCKWIKPPDNKVSEDSFRSTELQYHRRCSRHRDLRCISGLERHFDQSKTCSNSNEYLGYRNFLESKSLST